MTRSLALLTLVGCVFSGGPGCSPGPAFLPDALVFPESARRGDTIAMAIDSNTIPLDSLERHDLDLSNVTLRISENADPTCYQDLAAPEIRAVFTANAAAASRFAQMPEIAPSTTLTVAIIDLPADLLSCAGATPVNTTLNLLEPGGTLSDWAKGELTIIDGAGSVTEFTWGSVPDLEQGLRPEPSLRLQPSDLFPSDELVAIEFDLALPACVSDAAVFASSELGLGTALVGPEVDSEVHVVAADPKGFTLLTPDPPTAGRGGEGPLLEFIFTKACPFGATDFAGAITNLVLTRSDGSLAVDFRGASPDDSGTHFVAYAVENE